MLVYILVDNAAATADKVIGEIVQPIGADAPEMTARFRNPAGSVLGFCQHPRDLPSVRAAAGREGPCTSFRNPFELIGLWTVGTTSCRIPIA